MERKQKNFAILFFIFSFLAYLSPVCAETVEKSVPTQFDALLQYPESLIDSKTINVLYYKDVLLLEDIDKRTDNSETYEISEGVYLTKFYAKPVYVIQEKLSLLDYLLPTVYAQSTTTYSGSFDGYVEMVDSTWSTRRNADTGSDVGYSQTTGTLNCDGTNTLDRVFLPFDTSSLPDDLTISSSTLKMYLGYDYPKSGTIDLNLVETTQNPEALSTADFDAISGLTDSTAMTTSTDIGGTLYDSDIIDDGYNEIPLNETALDWIDPTGYTKLGLMCMRDTSFEAPTGAGYVRISYSDFSGTDHDPYLLIEYTDNGSGEESTSTTATSTDLTTTNNILVLFFGFVLFLFGLSFFWQKLWI